MSPTTKRRIVEGSGEYDCPWCGFTAKLRAFVRSWFERGSQNVRQCKCPACAHSWTQVSTGHAEA